MTPYHFYLYLFLIGLAWTVLGAFTFTQFLQRHDAYVRALAKTGKNPSPILVLQTLVVCLIGGPLVWISLGIVALRAMKRHAPR